MTRCLLYVYYMFNIFLDDYVTSTKCIQKSFSNNDGVIDYLTYLLSDFTYATRDMMI